MIVVLDVAHGDDGDTAGEAAEHAAEGGGINGRERHGYGESGSGEFRDLRTLPKISFAR